MNLTYAYIFLGIAIALEITGTSFVKDTEGFSKWVPTIICLVTICFSYYFMKYNTIVLIYYNVNILKISRTSTYLLY